MLTEKACEHIGTLAEWLQGRNGQDPDYKAMLVLKITEELGEVADAWADNDDAATAAELADVAVTALVAASAFRRPSYIKCTLLPASSVGTHILRVVAATGKAATAYGGMMGQNPRKGVTHSREDVGRELCELAAAALEALEEFRSLVGEPAQYFEKYAAGVIERARPHGAGESVVQRPTVLMPR